MKPPGLLAQLTVVVGNKGKCGLFMLQIHHNKKGKDTEHILAQIAFIFVSISFKTDDASISVLARFSVDRILIAGWLDI